MIVGQSKTEIGIGKVGVDAVRFAEKVEPLFPFAKMEKVGAEIGDGDIIFWVEAQGLVVIAGGGIDIVLEPGKDVADHDERIDVFRVPAQGVDQRVDGLILIALFGVELPEVAVVFGNRRVGLDELFENGFSLGEVALLTERYGTGELLFQAGNGAEVDGDGDGIGISGNNGLEPFDGVVGFDCGDQGVTVLAVLFCLREKVVEEVVAVEYDDHAFARRLALRGLPRELAANTLPGSSCRYGCSEEELPCPVALR